MSDRILVTGAGGFIAKNLLGTGKVSGLYPCTCWIGFDRSFENHVMELQPKTIIHLAAQSSVPVGEEHPDWDAKNNVLALLDVMRVAKVIGAKIVFPASFSPPDNPYGITKDAGVKYLDWAWRKYGQKSSVIRLSNVYGPGGHSARDKFREAMRRGKPGVIHGDGQQKRDFVHVDKVVEALLASANQTIHEPSPIVVSSGRMISIRDLWKEVAKELSFEGEPVYEMTYLDNHSLGLSLPYERTHNG